MSEITHSYCTYALKDDAHPLHQKYHDKVYGFPVEDDNQLFQRLMMEVNQAGLNWLTILKKQKAFEIAFDGYDIQTVANYDLADVERLMTNADIIRNRRKIEAAIHNAQCILELQDKHQSFKLWLHQVKRKNLKDLNKTFKKQGFKFVGEMVLHEFMMSASFHPGAHDKACEVYKQIEKYGPYWKD